MASLCKRQQCTIERRGFRQELDSWRYKLIHCVGFESILEGLFGQELVEDLALFKDCEPEVVSDWSYDENCLFCCLRREKVKEHLTGLNDQVLEEGEKALCKQEQSKINRLEKQAEEFLNAVFYRKEIPSFSDPHIPLVAREIMQRMIRQFAAEYTSKTSSSQDSLQPNGTKDQSLPKAPSLAAAPAASAQNPVLSKLLMEDQDSPLDLTVKKPEAQPSEQDGVLDLSTKKSLTSSSTSLRNSHGSPPMSIKGDSLDRSLAKVRDLQSTSTLQQFMAKLCRHHQRQIVDALGYLQTEVKAVADSCCPPQTDCSPLPQQKNTDFLCTGKRAAAATASTRTMNASLEVANLPNFIITVPQHPPECAGATGMAGEVRLTRSDPLDLRKVAPGYSRGSSFLFSSAGGERENKLQEDLLPLTEKNKSSTSQPEVKKSHMLESSSCTLVGTLHERQCNPETLLHPSRSDLSLEELSPSVRAHDHLYHTEQRVSSGRTKDLLVRSYPNKKASKTSPVSPRTARKSTRGPLPQHRDPVPQIINDPDIHCDIVYISKPITESELQSPNHISPRRNARKSTRGHAYIKECCELKTVRTLAGKSSPSDKGNCPAPVLETSTSVTPKHPLSKPDSVPPVDISFAGGCGETFVQKATLDQLMEKEIAADDVTLIGEADLIVQTSQTGKQPFITQTSATPEILSSLVSQQITEEEGRQQRHQEEGEESQSEEAYAPCFPKEVAQEDGNEEDACSDQPHVEGTGTVQPEDDLSNLAVAGSKEAESLIVSVDEPQTCASEPQSSPRLASPMLSTEDSIRSESMSAIIECEKQSQILELPMAEDLELSKDQEPSVHLAKETLAENEEQVEKDNFEEQKTNCTSSVSRETDDNVQEETRTDAVGGKAEVAVGKELSSVIDLPSEHCEVEGSKMEAAVTSSEIIAPKKGSSRDIAPSDRCLRRRIPLNTSETTNVSKTTEETPPLPQNQGSPVDDLKNSGSVRSNRSIRLRQPGVSTSLSHTVPQTTEEPVDKTQLSHEGKSNLGQVLDSMVQTRHKAMLAKQLESDGRNQGSKAASTSTAGSSTETDRLKVPSKLTQPKEKQAAPSVEEKIPGDSSASVENTLDKCRKMPLRRDRASSGLSTKPMSSATLMKHKKVVLRSQRSATLLAAGKKEEVEQNYADCSIKARAEKSPQLQKRDLDPFGLQKLDLSAPNPPKFLEALRGEENQLQITSLNTRYDRMQRGWVQLDKEGQPAPRPKNKADRLKEIWKSKRRVRKPRPLDQQKYSPVQMLFMKTFDLTSICRWFLQTTETKSLVIVKKVNTRLPSETQLCFHSSSGAQGSSHGVFPSLQAERLKKHLKKFAVASPVKSNAKNQKLIAKAWEQDGPCSKGKEKVKELTSATRISTKPYSHPHKLQTQAIENPKAVSAVKSPASARILRKYTNIREKLQVQQHALKTKETSAEDLKSSSVKPLISPKLMSKPKASLEQGKKTAPAGKTSGKEPHQSKNVKVNSLSSSKRDAFKKVVKEKGTKRSGSSKSLTSLSKKDHKALKRVPPSAPRPRKASASSSVASRLKERPVVTNRTSKATGVQKAGLVKDASQKSGGLNVQMKMPLRSKVVEHAAVHQQSPETLPSPSQDQVLTRSQRKMEAMPSTSGGSKPATKRTQEITLPPAKRTRTSLLK